MCVGILVEGDILRRQSEAQVAAEKLRSCKTNEECQTCATRLYTSSSFLYSWMNSSLRNKDATKIDTLGAFGFLLYWYAQQESTGSSAKTVYRGTTLTEEMVNQYKHSIGKPVTWCSFSSTTKNKEVAKFFTGNTLFIIKVENIDRGFACYNRDISHLSLYPDEEEVLFTLQQHFLVKKVKLESSDTGGVICYIIYLEATNECQ